MHADRLARIQYSLDSVLNIRAQQKHSRLSIKGLPDLVLLDTFQMYRDSVQDHNKEQLNPQFPVFPCL